MTLPLHPPLDPMLAKLTRELPPAGKVSYEPKWDGFRCIVFRDGDDLDLQSRNKQAAAALLPGAARTAARAAARPRRARR